MEGWLHINRELNVAAHNLAKQAMRNSANCSSSESNIYIWKHVQDDHSILNGHSDSGCNSLFSLSYLSLLQAVRNNVISILYSIKSILERCRILVFLTRF
ncbi:hypothetical protein Cni_G09538 [Canna indica]|uniref:Uncharacterized protein n=1 Tax=Canna indica TaxID=4628 RepID=A0AAQ3Q9R1_9LILI|nr:hypothetical protein Cni_G09538 [Canna indica]